MPTDSKAKSPRKKGGRRTVAARSEDESTPATTHEKTEPSADAALWRALALGKAPQAKRARRNLPG
jgi:hypothetical protein